MNQTMTPHNFAEQNHDRFLAELKEIIRIPSISTRSEHTADVQRAADWLCAKLEVIGLSAEQILMPEGRHPLVLGQWLNAGDDAPTVLIYGHYDVQPAEMADGWHTPPFEPTEKEGKLYARGSTDSKVNTMTQIKALESLMATDGRLPVNVKILLEGEEESGSENLNAFVAQQGERLSADIAVICDGGIVQPDQPSLICGLRGITTMELHVQGPLRDLHSGHYGGSVHNPIQALAEIIAKLHDDDGRVTIPGFYDNVREFTAKERADLAKLNPMFDGEWDIVAGAPETWGEPGFSLHERVGIRPTLEINGISGGYAEEGFKTVLPAKAMAKISCRLVANQDPDRIYQLIQDYIAQITPPAVNTELRQWEMGSRAVMIDLSAPAVQIARRAYETHWEVPAIPEMAGGSVPITFALQPLVKEVVLMGYAHKGGQPHGPNEHIILRNYPRGIATAITFLQEVGNTAE